MARPSKLTEEVQTRIVQLIRAGNTVEVAAKTAGISEATFYGWLARAEAEASKRAGVPFVEFRAAVLQARAEAEAMLVTRIAKAAGNGSWAAAAWLLERRFPQRWAKPSLQDAANAAPALNESEEGGDVATQDRFAALDELASRREGRAG